MKELKCPKCGSIIKVDEADYSQILSQVRNQEFENELSIRLEEKKRQIMSDNALKAEKSEFAYQSKLNDKESEIKRLEQRLTLLENEKTSAVQIAVLKEQQSAEKQLSASAKKINELESQIQLDASKHENEINSLKEQHKSELDMFQKEIDFYKDMKTRLSTKMIGESLETHCSTQYEQILRPVLPNAYFAKDNDTTQNGEKGDFIFRDYSPDGVEYISIMFEMKNEADETINKHKNESFFKKLDSDRVTKKCEYAVLVSLLEPESELYNSGIVDVSHKYEKMYVIRPQFFIPIITLLRQTSMKAMQYKTELEIARQQNIDITNFESKLSEFQTKFGRHFMLASQKYETAIKQIDNSIETLKKIKAMLLGSEEDLRLANKDVDELTIRKLTYKNPTMREKFKEARERGLPSSDE